MNERQILRRSFNEAVAADPQLPARFYRKFFALSEDIPRLFSSIDLEAQAKMLARALDIVVEHEHDREQLRPVLEGLGYRHIDYGVKHEHYPLVVEALLATLAEVLEGSWTNEREGAWRDMLEFVTGAMIEGSLSVSELIADEHSSRGRAALLPVGDGYYMSRFSEAPRPVIEAEDVLSDELPRTVRVDFVGETAVDAAPLQTVLQVSKENELPHMCECGGNAKCTTCRILVLEGEENLLPRTAKEEIAHRRAFPDQVRLACQCRVAGPVRVRRLVLDREDAVSAYREGEMATAREASLAVLFADVRGFTRLSSETLPYDIVHALNRYFAAVCEEIDKEQGYVDKFIGDGLMALFGLATENVHPAEAAVRAALGMQAAMPKLNRYLNPNMGMSFTIGVGIHYGPVVVGELGFRLKKQFTAIGDTVNVAARVEGQTKTLGAPILVTDSVAEHLDLERFPLRDPAMVSLAGKSEQLRVHPVVTPRMDTWNT